MAATKSINMDVKLTGRMKQLSLFGNNATMDIDEVYKNELDSSTKYRLIFTINPVCSNVLYNAITEVLVDDGAEEMLLLSDAEYTGAVDAINKQPVTRVQAIRDTEYSHPLLGGFTYHPGVDLLNNHLFRQNGFNSVMKMKGGSNQEKEKIYWFNYGIGSTFIEGPNVFAFNTIRDYKRNYNGDDIKGKVPYSNSGTTYSQSKKISLHLYDDAAITSFNDTIQSKIYEENGWFGFYNPATLNTPMKAAGKEVFINKGLNYEDARAGDFIDFFPDRTRFSFAPHINSKQKNRLEYNWRYCLTYHSGSDYTHPLVSDGTVNGLVFKYVKTYTTDSGREKVLLVSCTSRHNLKAKSKVRMYWDIDGVMTVVDATVSGLGNMKSEMEDYYFSVDIEDVPDGYEDSKGGRFARMRFNTPCEYYLQVLTRIPNFKELGNAEDKANYEEEYSTAEYDFDSEISKLAFSTTIYGDENVQIVYTDDIDIDGLKDERGKKITDIYLTLVKNNDSYENWYKMCERNPEIGREIEYSSCFGKITAGINIPDGEDFSRDYNIRCLHNIDKAELESKYPNDGYEHIKPLSFDKLWVEGNTPKSISFNNNEVKWDDREFYGDLVEYSPLQMEEVILEEMYHRFNTLQRETIFDSGSTFTNITFDEIYKDDFEGSQDGVSKSEFVCAEEKYNSYRTRTTGANPDNTSHEVVYPGNLFPEGYFYKPHYKIHLLDENENLSQSSDTQVNTLDSIQVINPRLIAFDTDEEISPNTEMVIQKYDVAHSDSNEGLFPGVVASCMASDQGYTVSVELKEDINYEDGYEYIVFKKTSGIPDYAVRYPDNSGRYVWREIKKDSEVDSDSEIYNRPFANGAHYIHKGLNFFLRRQDPDGKYGLNINEETVDSRYAGANRLTHIVRSSQTKPELKEELDYIKDYLFDIC